MFGSFRKQKAVYWADSGTTDGFGSSVYQTPLEIDVRWELKNELYVDDKGNENTSQAVIYPNTELTLNGYLYLGELADLSVEQQADPILLDDSFIISKIQKIPSINNIEFMFKVWL